MTGRWKLARYNFGSSMGNVDRKHHAVCCSMCSEQEIALCLIPEEQDYKTFAHILHDKPPTTGDADDGVVHNCTGSLCKDAVCQNTV